MEAVEVVVYMLLAVMVGSLLLYFFVSMDAEQLSSDVQKAFSGEQQIQFRYDREEFIQSVFALWNDCAMGETEKKYTVFIDGRGTISVDDVWNSIVKYNHARELPRDKLIFRRITLPSVIQVACNNNGLFIGNDYVIIISYQDTSFINCQVDEDDYLDCETPQGKTGITNIIVRAYNQTEMVAEAKIIVAITESLSFEASKATYISSSYPNKNFDDDLFLYSGSSSGIRRILLEFGKLLGVDPAKVVGADLVLTQLKPTSGQLSENQQLQIYLSSTAWDPASVTWNSPWSRPGGDYPSTAFGQAVVTDNVQAGRVVEQVRIPITELVRSWINIPGLSQQVIVKTADE
ncbi:MAG: DNRLRE domain-containing protein, partial [Candidatus Woesearchaeota archaeon]